MSDFSGFGTTKGNPMIMIGVLVLVLAIIAIIVVIVMRLRKTKPDSLTFGEECKEDEECQGELLCKINPDEDSKQTVCMKQTIPDDTTDDTTDDTPTTTTTPEPTDETPASVAPDESSPSGGTPATESPPTTSTPPSGISSVPSHPSKGVYYTGCPDGYITDPYGRTCTMLPKIVPKPSNGCPSLWTPVADMCMANHISVDYKVTNTQQKSDEQRRIDAWTNSSNKGGE